MKKILVGSTVLALCVLGYACKKDTENPVTIPTPVQYTASLSNAGGGSTSTGTGSFVGTLSQATSSGSAQTSNVLSYTVNFSGVSPTAITLDPVTSTSGTTNYSNSILLAGSFPSTTTTPGSGTATTPGSGTTTTPGSGTSTTPGSGTTTTPGSGTTTTPGSGTTTEPGSGTTTTPGSGTSTTPGSGTTTTPGSGTSTSPGSGTSTTPGSGTATTPGSGTAITLTTPITGTVSMSQSRADSLSRGLYRLNLRSANYPSGEIGGTVQIR